MTEKRLGIGLIGTGNIGRIHLTGLAALVNSKLLNVKIVALCDTDSESLQQAAELFEVETTYVNYEELVNDRKVDLVYVCTPTNKHVQMVKATVVAGKHVFCEKPLAHSSPQASELNMVVTKAGVLSGVGLVLRFDQLLLYAKNLIEEYDFGKPMVAHIRDDQHFPVDHIYYSKWRGDRSIAGGGTLIEHSIHDIDLLQWFFGKIESVYAKIGFYAEREVEDHASLIMTHESGLVSTLDSIWHWLDRPNERRLEFFFEKGYIGITLESGNRYLEYHLQEKGPVKISEDQANSTLISHLGLEEEKISIEAVETLTAVGAERYAALSYSLIKSIECGSQPSPNFLDAISAHKIVDAAYESSDKLRCIDRI